MQEQQKRSQYRAGDHRALGQAEFPRTFGRDRSRGMVAGDGVGVKMFPQFGEHGIDRTEECFRRQAVPGRVPQRLVSGGTAAAGHGQRIGFAGQDRGDPVAVFDPAECGVPHARIGVHDMQDLAPEPFAGIDAAGELAVVGTVPVRRRGVDLFRFPDAGVILPEHEHRFRVVRELRQHRQRDPFGGDRADRGPGGVDADPGDARRIDRAQHFLQHRFHAFEIIQRMLAEKISDTLDARIWNHYSLKDIDEGTLVAYRQMFSNRSPVHPFNGMPDMEFLRNLGGWRVDRESGERGLTTAGLLMFGKLRSILDAFPNYIVDYREYGRQVTEEQRWDDRVTTDYSWPGNLFSFCRIVLPKLYQSLKVPFRLEQGVRVDESPVHIALREALVNALIHADYGEGGAILVVKRPDLFGFRNPGTLRIRKEDAIRGGTMNSDCRNRNLQKMFQMIGYADQAGSGFPKIYSGWASQDWKKPEFREDFNHSQTYLALRMTSLLPEDAVAAATAGFGNRFLALPPLERLAVVTAFAEEEVNHSRLAELCTDHHADISDALRGLVQNGFLESSGHGRGTVYRPARAGLTPGAIGRGATGGRDQVQEKGDQVRRGEGPSSHEKGPSSGTKGPSSGMAGGDGTGNAAALRRPLNKGKRDCLTLLAQAPLSAATLRTRMERSNATKFRNHILAPLLEDGLIEPTLTPRQHPKQQYRITEAGKILLRDDPPLL